MKRERGKKKEEREEIVEPQTSSYRSSEMFIFLRISSFYFVLKRRLIRLNYLS